MDLCGQRPLAKVGRFRREPEARRFNPTGLSPLFVFLHGELINVSISYRRPWTREHEGNSKWEKNCTWAFSSPCLLMVSSACWTYFSFRFFIVFFFPLLLVMFSISDSFALCLPGNDVLQPGQGCNLKELATFAYLLFRRSVSGLDASDFIKWF